MGREKKKNQRGEILTAVVLGLCTVVGLVGYRNIAKWGHDVENTSGDNLLLVLNNESEGIELPTFSSKQEILDKINEAKRNNNKYYLTDGIIFETASDMNLAVNTGAAMTDNINASFAESSKDMEYSTTNVQVQGVDEGDIVKTNGKFIYYVANNRLYIFNTETTETKLVKTIDIPNSNNYSPREVYIDDNYITLIWQGYENRKEVSLLNDDKEENKDTLEKESIAYWNDTEFTTMHIYDIKTYELVKEVKTEGNYISSRKIDNNIYVVTNKYIYTYRTNEDDILPIYKESSISNECYNEIPAQEIKYFPDIDFNNDCSYMLITSIDLNNLDKKASIETYLGAGTEIYSSKEHLYVTKVEYTYRNNRRTGMLIDLATDVIESISDDEERVKTKIHKFKLLDGGVKYVATGEVAGSLLNQYSMDETKGYFRITTTSEKGNSLYVLNESLQTVGSLKNLAKGERIYATRFMGDKCYIVTYKTVDPLFVIDLSNPSNPCVLGELKIPGYSTYLHPLGENHLIGFGEDSIEKSYTNWEGKQEVIAYNTGLKLAIFDITDLNNPKELHSIKIGGRGSSSVLLNNPRVLYYNEEEEIFAFPASVTEETKFYEDGTPMYGNMIFEGALVYNLSVEDGIELRGKIAHKTVKELMQYKTFGYEIERIISIRDNFYTLSPNMIKVTNIDTMEEIKEGTCEFGENKK